MPLLELPSGDWIDPTTVVGVRTMADDKLGPRVLIDVTTTARVLVVEFDLPGAARSWASEFAEKVNVAVGCAPAAR